MNQPALEITTRHGKALSRSGQRPSDAPPWIDDIDNPYLHGLFAPIQSEVERTSVPVISGKLPSDLRGAYYRNGPNQIFAPTNRYHWFDGDGMVHAVWFDGERAHYANRWIATRGLALEREQGRAIWPGVLGPFDFSLPLGPLKDTGNTDLIYYDKKLLALWYESGDLYSLDPATLDNNGIDSLAPSLDVPISAHSKVDPNTGELIFFSYGDRPPYMRYGVIRSDGTVHRTDVTLPGPRRPHDIGVTPNYSILHDFPVFFDPEHFKRTGKRVPLFHPEVPTRYGVIPRFGTDSDIRWFEFAPCYMLHVVNCWEDGDWLVMTGCRTRDPSLHPDRRDGKLAAMLSFLKLQANLYQWRINLRTGETSEGDLDDLNAEFPMINDRWLGTKNRYSYHQAIPYEIPATFDALIKYDLETATYQRWNYGDGVFGSEAPFAPRVDARGEDDGYVITMVTDTQDWTSRCLVFDATDIERGPICTLALPQRVPAGFHSTWVASAD